MLKLNGRALLFVVSFSGCAEPEKNHADVPDNGQTYRDAIGTLCGVDEAAGVTSASDVLEVADKRHEYLQSHVKHPDGIYFYTLFRTQGPKEQSAALRAEAKSVGLMRCALADELGEQGKNE